MFDTYTVETSRKYNVSIVATLLFLPPCFIKGDSTIFIFGIWQLYLSPGRVTSKWRSQLKTFIGNLQFENLWNVSESRYFLLPVLALARKGFQLSSNSYGSNHSLNILVVTEATLNNRIYDFKFSIKSSW